MDYSDISLESILLDLWNELFTNIIEYCKGEKYALYESMMQQLLANGELNQNEMPSAESIFKFNKIVFICTQIVDYDSVLEKYFKKHFEKFNIRMIKKDYNLRYRNKIALARMLNNNVNYNNDLSNLEYWDKLFRNIKKQSFQNSNMSELSSIAMLENYLKIIAKLNKIIGNVMNDLEEYKTPIGELSIVSSDSD
nr:P6 protein [Jujube yellow mottle-associated virus]